MHSDRLSTVLSLLGELEGQLDGNPDPQLTELRDAIGAALAALYRANVEWRLTLEEDQVTRH